MSDAPASDLADARGLAHLVIALFPGQAGLRDFVPTHSPIRDHCDETA
jgi:hypothetical protein